MGEEQKEALRSTGKFEGEVLHSMSLCHHLCCGSEAACTGGFERKAREKQDSWREDPEKPLVLLMQDYPYNSFLWKYLGGSSLEDVKP